MDGGWVITSDDVLPIGIMSLFLVAILFSYISESLEKKFNWNIFMWHKLTHVWCSCSSWVSSLSSSTGLSALNHEGLTFRGARFGKNVKDISGDSTKKKWEKEK